MAFVVVQTSLLDVPFICPEEGVSSSSHQKEAKGMTQGTLKGICLLAGLGVPQACPSRAGEGFWREENLAVSADTAAPVT